MLDFLAAIGLSIVEVQVSPGRCAPVPPLEQRRQASSDLAALVLQAPPPLLVRLEGGDPEQYVPITGQTIIAAACAYGWEKVLCYLVTPALSPGVREFLVAAGQLYSNIPIHSLLRAQTVWLIFAWSNAQSRYVKALQESPLPKGLVPPLSYMSAAGSIDDVDTALARYMTAFFRPMSDYVASGRVLVPWRVALEPFPAMSESRRKSLVQLLQAVPPELRPDLRNIPCSDNVLQTLTKLAPETLPHVIRILRTAPPDEQKTILRRIHLEGSFTLPAVAATGFTPPPDAFPPVFPPQDRLDPATFQTMVQAWRQLNMALQSLPARPRLSPVQRRTLWDLSEQTFNLCDPLLDEQK